MKLMRVARDQTEVVKELGSTQTSEPRDEGGLDTRENLNEEDTRTDERTKGQWHTQTNLY